MAAILTGRADPPEHAGPLRDLIESLLAKDPAARPDARSAVNALAAATASGLTDQSAAGPGPRHDSQVVDPPEADGKTPVIASGSGMSGAGAPRHSGNFNIWASTLRRPAPVHAAKPAPTTGPVRRA